MIKIKKDQFKKRYIIVSIEENEEILIGKARTYKRAISRYIKEVKQYLQKKGIEYDMF